jgi:hypothetical protein
MPVPIGWVENGRELKQDFEDYKSVLATILEKNLNIINELPNFPNFTKTEIQNHLAKLLEAQLQKDEIIEKSVQIRKYSRGINIYINNYFSEIFAFHKKIVDDVIAELQKTCKDFFNSDFSLSFLKLIESECFCLCDYLKIYDKRLTQEHLKLAQNLHNEKKFKFILDEHNNWIIPFTKRLNKMEHERVKLMWYIDLCNCSTLDDFDETKPLQLSKLNKEYLDGLTSNIERLVLETNNLIRPHIQFQPITSYEDSSAMVIRNVMGFF